MKRSFYPYIKIKKAIDIAVFGIALSVFISFIAAIVIWYYLPELLWLGFIVFISGFFMTTFLIYLICTIIVKKEAFKHKKYIKLTVDEKSLSELFEKQEPIAINDTSFVYVYQEKMLNTISVFYLNEQVTYKDIQPLRKEVKNFLTGNYEAAREKCIYKRHQELNVQLYVTDEFNSNILVHLTDGGEQMNDIGFFKCYWCVGMQSVWIPFYKGKFMDYFAAKNYHKAYKKIIQLFDCIDYGEEDFYNKI